MECRVGTKIEPKLSLILISFLGQRPFGVMNLNWF